MDWPPIIAAMVVSVGCGGSASLPRELATLFPADSVLAACADSNRASGQTICRGGSAEDRWEVALDGAGEVLRLVRTTQVPVDRFESEFRMLRRRNSEVLGSIDRSGGEIYQWVRPPFTVFAIRRRNGVPASGGPDSMGVIISELVRSSEPGGGDP